MNTPALTSNCRTRFDLSEPASNGLMRGFTTGSCATAAAKAALLKLLCNEEPTEVEVSMPRGPDGSGRFLLLPIAGITVEAEGVVRADVIKDAGNDPDQTHRARIFVRVRRNDLGRICFLRGEGVGLVTQPGLQIPVGEPAINPVPRQMLINAVHEVLELLDDELAPGIDLEVGCQNGAEIAKRTFNPRLGIQGGISILGTSGIVEPKSMAAFRASIEIYVRVALGENPVEIVLSPGNLGQRFARTILQLPLKQTVQMANFFGFALECVQRTLEANQHQLETLWVIGHPGKVAKALDGVWDTHSQQSGTAVVALCRVARAFGLPDSILEPMEQSNTAEGIIELLADHPQSQSYWIAVEKEIEEAVLGQLRTVAEPVSVGRVIVRLFQMDGKALGVLQ